MNKKDINIARILMDRPKGTFLYSTVWGDCIYEGLVPGSFVKKCIVVSEFFHPRKQHSFLSNGKLSEEGDYVLLPSSTMKDWNKFTWKKGDVLVSNDGVQHVIFEEFAVKSYAQFIGWHLIDNNQADLHYKEKCLSLETNFFSLEEEDAAQCYVNTIEKRFGGKLNWYTLELEKKVERTFKPFEQVLVRNYSKIQTWGAAFYSHYDSKCKYHHKVIGRGDYDRGYIQCIPFKGNEQLLGTTDEPKH